MEGWYVKNLLLNRDNIRSRAYGEFVLYNDNVYDDYFSGITVDINVDDETYLDLLQMEVIIKLLDDRNLLSSREIDIINYVFDGKSVSDISRELKISRLTVLSTFKKLCAKLSQYLGSHFTNEGYLNYMIKKYKLDEEQTKTIRRILNK